MRGKLIRFKGDRAAMASTLRKVQSGWLSRSIEQAKQYENEHSQWVVQVRDNWQDSSAKNGQGEDTPKSGRKPA